MNGFGRRAFLQASAATLAAAGAGALGPSPARARAAPLKLKLGNDLPAAHSVNARLREAIDAIAADTDGRVSMGLFPNNQLGSDSDMMFQLRSGALELATVPGTVLSTLIPATSLTGLGFIFTSCDKVWAAMDGEVGTISAAPSARRTWSRSTRCGTTASARSRAAPGRSGRPRT